MTEVKKKISNWRLIRVFFRSFFLQSVWNYQSLISVGFAYALVPVLNLLYDDQESKINFLRRHLNFFNAHPYFASFALGAVIRIEQEISEGKGDPEQVPRLKNAMIGPLGALGDQMFWGTIKPAAVLLGVIAVLITQDVSSFLYIIIGLLLIYNIPHFYIRFYGIREGYRQGFAVYKLLSMHVYKKYINFYVALGAMGLGFVISYSFLTYEEVNTFHGIAFILCVSVAYYYHKIKRSFYRNVGFSLLTAILLGIIIESI